MEAHIFVFPYPAQGHMISLLDFTHQLSTRGLAVTILVTPKNLPLLNPLLSANPSIKTLVLPFPTHPKIPPGLENCKDLPPSSSGPMMCALGGLYEPLLNWFKSHPSPPQAIISDMFLGWTHRLASDLNIPRFVFSPSGAMASSVICSLWQNMPRPKTTDPNKLFSFPDVPNCPKYPWWQLSPIYRSYVEREGDPDWEFIRDGMLANTVSWGMVFNSVTKLEEIYLDHLRKKMGHDRIWAVGPLLPPPKNDPSGPTERGGSSSVSVNELVGWLDSCEDRTVVYVCFGSQALLTYDQMEAVASGLDRSGVRFVWSAKEPANGQAEGGYGRVPVGFEHRVAGRGLVVRGWAPQVLILGHRAVGAFLTHCGWNSVLEGLVAGVPMLAWPMGADQFVNADLLVDELKVGKRVCEGARTVPNSSELARAVRESVTDNEDTRKKAEEISKAALDAIGDGGSSTSDLDGLVTHLVGLASRGE